MAIISFNKQYSFDETGCPCSCGPQIDGNRRDFFIFVSCNCSNYSITFTRTAPSDQYRINIMYFIIFGETFVFVKSKKPRALFNQNIVDVENLTVQEIKSKLEKISILL